MISKKVRIEIIYALADTQTVLSLEVPRGTTLKQALKRSKLALIHPEINLESAVVGIFGRRVSGDTILNNYDRIEVYRSLAVDPKTSRRLRASLLRRR